MLNFDFFETSSHAVLYEFREAGVSEVVLLVLPFELGSIVPGDFDRQTPRHNGDSSALHISCYLELSKTRQVFIGKCMGIGQCLLPVAKADVNLPIPALDVRRTILLLEPPKTVDANSKAFDPGMEASTGCLGAS